MARKRAMKWNFCVTIAILNANNQVTNNRHARAITRELLVCRLCIILLTLFQLVRCKHTIEQLSIEDVSRIEIVVLTRI